MFAKSCLTADPSVNCCLVFQLDVSHNCVDNLCALAIKSLNNVCQRAGALSSPFQRWVEEKVQIKGWEKVEGSHMEKNAGSLFSDTSRKPRSP